MRQEHYYYDIWIKKPHQVDNKQRQGVIVADDVSDALTRVEKFISAWGAVIVSAKVYLLTGDGDMELLLQTSKAPPEEKTSHSVTPRKTTYPSQYGSVFRPQTYSTMVLEES